MFLQLLFFILGPHLSKSTLLPRHSGHGSQTNSTSTAKAQIPSPSPSAQLSLTASSGIFQGLPSSPPPRVEYVYTTEYTTVFLPRPTPPFPLSNMTTIPKTNSTTTTTLTEFVTVQPSSIANITTFPVSSNVPASSAPPAVSSPAPASSFLHSAIQISSAAIQPSTPLVVSTAVVIVPTSPVDSTAIVIMPVSPAMDILIPRATSASELNDIQHEIDVAAPILPRNSIYDPPPAELDDLLQGAAQTSTVTITRTVQPVFSPSKVPMPSFSTKPSHTSKTQPVQTTTAPANAAEPDHPRCPYPYPGIKCGSGRGKITLTTTSTTTKTLKSSTSSTASDWCPYPGLRC